jgi:hypothetical protein
VYVRKEELEERSWNRSPGTEALEERPWNRGPSLGTEAQVLEQRPRSWNRGPGPGTEAQVLEQRSRSWNRGPGTEAQVLEQRSRNRGPGTEVQEQRPLEQAKQTLSKNLSCQASGVIIGEEVIFIHNTNKIIKNAITIVTSEIFIILLLLLLFLFLLL